MDPVDITAGRLHLRPWEAADAGAVLLGASDPSTQRWTQVPVPYRRADAEDFVGRLSPAMWAEGGASFAVESRGGGSLAGSIGLFPPADGFAEIGYWTVAEHRGRGLTAEAVGVLSDWHSLRAGFGEEGLIRQRFRHRGVPTDNMLYSRLAADPHPGA